MVVDWTPFWRLVQLLGILYVVTAILIGLGYVAWLFFRRHKEEHKAVQKAEEILKEEAEK
jgi:hypothetical protein